MPLDEAIEDDEEIAAAHLADAQLREADLAVVPGVRHYGVGVAADDRFQRQFDRKIEVVREDRLYARDHLTAIALESIGRVVRLQLEKQTDEQVDETIEHELVRRIVDYFAAAPEPRAEHAVVALVHFVVEFHHIIRIVGAVGHEDRHPIATKGFQSGAHGKAEASWVLIGHMAQSRELLFES